jgi:exopolysaccharide production protein ExoZ
MARRVRLTLSAAVQLSGEVKDKIASLQVVRFAAASLVIALHSTETILGHTAPRPLTALGPMGVDLFFVLSGYIMATVAADAEPMEFLRRRFLRIAPLYYLVTLAFMAELALAGQWSPSPLLSSFLFVPVPGSSTYLNVAWTLDYELLFYVAFAIVLAGRRLGLAAVLAAFALGLLGHATTPGPVSSFAGNPLIMEFLAGVAVAKAPKNALAARAAFGLGLALAVTIGAQSVALDGWSRPLTMIWPSALLIYGAAQFTLRGPWWARLAYLGDASYSAYLVHQLPLSVARALRGVTPALPTVLMLIAVCWLVAVLLYEGAERPLIRLLGRRPAFTPAPQQA